MKRKTTNRKKQEARTKNRHRLPPPQVRGLGEYSPDLASLGRASQPNESVRIPLDLIDIPAHIQERPLDLEKVRTYAAGLEARGLVNPITVLPKEGGRYELETGRHRLEAHRLRGYVDVPATIQADGDPARAAFRRNVENLHRREYRPYEEAQGYKEMLDAKWSLPDVSRILGVPAATIKARLRLLALPPDIGARVGEPGFPLSHAEILLPLAPHPKLLGAAKGAMGQLDFDKRPLTVHGFQEAVEKALRGGRFVKDLGTWQVRELGQKYPEFRKQVYRLPMVRLGSGHAAKELCIDPSGYRKAVAPFQDKERQGRERREAEEAKQRAKQPSEDEYQERRQRRHFVEAFYAHEHAERIEKAAKASLGVDDRLLGLVALDAVHHLGGQGRR